MLGGKATSLPKDGWYVIARDGNLVLRIRPGMQLGEDPAGELRFDGRDPELTFDIREDGRLVLVAADGHELEVEAGERSHSIDLGYESHVRIRLPNNELSLATDLRGGTPPPDDDSIEIVTTRVAAVADPAPQAVVPNDDVASSPDIQPEPLAYVASADHETPEGPATPDDDPAPEPDPDVTRIAPPRLFGTGLPAALTARGADERLILVPEPKPAPSGAASPAEAASDDTLEAVRTGERAERTPSPPPPTRPRRRLVAAVALGSAAALVAVSYLTFQPAEDSAAPTVAIPASSVEDLAPAVGAAEAPGNPVVADVSAATSADPSATGSGRAGTAAEPVGDPTSPAIAAGDLLPQAPPASRPQQQPANGSGEGQDPIGQTAVAEAGSIADAAARAPALLIEPVYVPPILRKEMPEAPPEPGADTAGSLFASLESPASNESTADAAPAPGEQLVVDAEPASSEPADPAVASSAGGDLEQAAQPVPASLTLANERDLRAAANALERGLLMSPPAASAFALYSRVLESDPDSPIAQSGLQLVQERLLMQARAALTADQVDVAIAAIDAAAGAGVDLGIVSRLRAQATYRQLLRDAKAGIGGALYPIGELTALSQDAPTYPRHAPAGAESSVDIEMTVTENGGVRDLQVLGDPPMYFVRAARQAVGEWRFAPVLLDGQAVPVRTSVRVTFRREE